MAWQDGPPPPVTCEVCGRKFTVSAMARNPRYCTRTCQIRASTAIRSERRRERRQEAERTPQVPAAPVMPWRIAGSGLCGDPATLRQVGRHIWTDPASRSLAEAVCKSCPVCLPCQEWAVTYIARTDTAIYAGMTAFGRDRIRRERRRPAAAPAQPDTARGKASA